MVFYKFSENVPTTFRTFFAIDLYLTGRCQQNPLIFDRFKNFCSNIYPVSEFSSISSAFRVQFSKHFFQNKPLFTSKITFQRVSKKV